MRYFLLSLNGRDSGGVAHQYLYSNIAHYNPNYQQNVSNNLTNAGVMRRDLIADCSLHSSSDYNLCAFELSNLDGSLNALDGIAFDGMDVYLQELDPATFAVLGSISTYIFAGTIDQLVWDVTKVTVSAREFRQQMDKPLLPEKYAGTNSGSPESGIEGDAGLAGNTKPLLMGTVFNMTPVLVNKVLLTYQYLGQFPNAGNTAPLAMQTSGFSAPTSLVVYDRRVALTRGTDYTSQADMEANTPAAGAFRVWPSGAVFRLGSVPLGTPTCDVTMPNGAMYQVLSLIVGQSARGNGVAANYFPEYPAPCGLYLTSEATIKEAFEALAGNLSIGLVTNIGASPEGPSNSTSAPSKMLISVPAAMPSPYWATGPSANFPLALDASVVDLNSTQSIISKDSDRGIPVWKVTVRYNRNYTVMTDDEIAGSVSATVRAQCTKEWQTVTVSDSSVLTQWKSAGEIVVDSGLVNQSDATAAANRLLTTFKIFRRIWRVQVAGSNIRSLLAGSGGSGNSMARVEIGMRATLTLPFGGLPSGKTFYVIGVEEDLKTDMQTLTLWWAP